MPKFNYNEHSTKLYNQHNSVYLNNSTERFYTQKKTNTRDAHGSRLALSARKCFEEKMVKISSGSFSMHLVPSVEDTLSGYRNPVKWLEPVLCALDWQIFSANTYSLFVGLVFRLSTCE